MATGSRSEKTQQAYFVTRENIDIISENVKRFLEENKISRELRIRTGLCVEEILLALHEEYGEALSVEVLLAKRFGKPWISLQYRGERFDPADRSRRDDVSELILSGLGITPKWSFRRGVNCITFRLPSSGIRSEVLLAGAVALAVLLGLCGGFIPAGVKAGLIQYLLSPLTDVFMRLMSTVAPMVMFLSVVTGIIQGGSGTDFGKIGKYVILRYILVSAASGVLFAAALAPLFRFNYVQGAAVGTADFGSLLEMLVNIVPSNPILPFSENNAMQIIVLAILVGMIILGLDNRVDGLRKTIFDLNTVFMSAMELVCGILPLFIFASLLTLIWGNGFDSIVTLWKPIVVTALAVTVYVIVQGIYVACRLKVSVLRLAKKIMPSFIIGLTTASSLAAYTKGNEINKKQLGIAPRYSDLAYPLGITLYLTTYIPLNVVITYYLAEFYQVAVSPGWFITAGIVFLIVSYATPQVSGGALLCLTILLSQLGVPMEGLAAAGILALVLDFVVTGAKVAGQHLEMVLQARHLGMLDLDTLKTDNGS